MSLSPHLRPCVRRKIVCLIETFILAVTLATASFPAHAQSADSDYDGLSDTLEQSLLVQFVPHFQIGQADCANLPAEFQPKISRPLVKSQNGTIYGQVFPSKDPMDGAPAVEIHYYHLWQTDCGKHGHPLDAEHVSVLVQASGGDLASASWHALFWYAAAHEDTVCDVSQIAHASTLHAQDSGPTIWVSPGKHASYLNNTLCRSGCGADRCEKMTALTPGQLINLGEPGHPMNGSAFIAATAWPLLADKMNSTNFPAATRARLNALPNSEIAWFNTGRHPAQGIIAISSTTEGAITGSLSTANDATDSSLTKAQDETGNALQKSYRNTIHGLGTATHQVGRAIGADEESVVQKPAVK
jgi:hypothetical protein